MRNSYFVFGILIFSLMSIVECMYNGDDNLIYNLEDITKLDISDNFDNNKMNEGTNN